MRARTWRWLKTRMVGLLAVPPSGVVRLPIDEQHERIKPVWRTRIQFDLYEEA